ncbi:MAG: AI-2E family transporter [Pseudomonadota bacterium]
MSQPNPDAIRWIALLGVTALVSILFIGMVKPFLVAITLAAITAAMSARLQGRMMALTGSRRGFSATLTLIVLVVSVVGPLLGVMFLAAEQAKGMSEGAEELVKELRGLSPDDPLPEWVPFRNEIGSHSAEIMAKLGELTSAISGFAASVLGHIASGTAQFFLNLFIYLYALFMFVQMDRSVITQIFSFTGLPHKTQAELADRMVLISKATIKGTFVIGLAQGSLGALGFWVVGIHGAAFWGVIMLVFSVIPGIGPLIIILGGSIWLFTQDQLAMGLGLAIWGIAAVSTIDNILRPILVGRTASLHNVLILISTLGGLASFGAVGLVLGPVLAGLFVTLWQTLARTAASPDYIDVSAPGFNEEGDPGGAEQPDPDLTETEEGRLSK